MYFFILECPFNFFYILKFSGKILHLLIYQSFLCFLEHIVIVTLKLLFTKTNVSFIYILVDLFLIPFFLGYE